MSYQKSIDELEEIVSMLEQSDVSVDELSKKVKRASELIDYCKKALSSTEIEVKNILSKLDDSQSETSGSE